MPLYNVSIYLLNSSHHINVILIWLPLPKPNCGRWGSQTLIIPAVVQFARPIRQEPDSGIPVFAVTAISGRKTRHIRVSVAVTNSQEL